MDSIEGAPTALVVLAAGGVLLGIAPLLWMGRRLVRTLLRKPQPAVGVSRYLSALLTSFFLLVLGLGASGILLTIRGYRAFTNKTRVAELQCVELSPQKLRVYFVPIDAEGLRGATETYDVDGDEWQVGGEVMRFRPFLTPLGLETVHKVTRIEGRWVKAEDANKHTATAHDVGGGTTSGWLALYRDGARGPLKWLVDGVHGQSVSQLPDRRAVFDLSITPNGYIVDKRTL